MKSRRERIIAVFCTLLIVGAFGFRYRRSQVHEDLGLALIDACVNGDQERMNALLKRGADPNYDDGEPMRRAAQNSFVQLIFPLLDAGAKPVDAAVAALLSVGKRDAAMLLMERGACHSASPETNLALFAASGAARVNQGAPPEGPQAASRVRVIDALLERGADVNTSSLGGMTALMASAAAGNTDVASQLLAHGASVNAVDVDGQTALIVAVNNGSEAIVKDLLAHDASVRISPKRLATAVSLAAKEHHSGIVALVRKAMAKS